MTADPATLLRLATDIETLEGPDREMDARVWAILEQPDGRVPQYTASVDAALALLREVLPGWRPAITEYYARGGFSVQLTVLDPERWPLAMRNAYAPTLPLAICAAVLRAVAAREGSDA